MVNITHQTEKLSKMADGTGRSSSFAKASRKADDFPADGCFKRRRIHEIQFAASRVKEDLEKGGLSFPTLHDSSMCLEIFGSAAECKGIQLLSSRSVSSSPFLTDICGPEEVFSKVGELEDLLAVTYDSYSNDGTPASSDWSTNCSLISESEISGTAPFEITPLLETALQKETKTNSSVDEAIMNDAEAAIYANPITIREAFENSNEPRYG
jgi:hypothetical protein